VAVALGVDLYTTLVLLLVSRVEVESHDFAVVQVSFEFSDYLHVSGVPGVEVLPD